MNRYKISTLLMVVLAMVTSACLDDLNREPLNKRVTTSNMVFSNTASYKEFLAKLYGALTLTGQRGEFGMPEISAPDEGTTSFLRTYWSAQEITTDECISAWGDPGLVEFHGHLWSEQNYYIQLLYQRIFINIAYCNEYIREVPSRISGLPQDMQADVTQYVAEARFLRALYYYFAMDLWGNVPFVTEQDATGAFLPRQILRAELFDYIESELLDILPTLANAGANEYARADKATAWMLLAKMYLNAEVYTGEDRYTDAVTYTENIINSEAFSLHASYEELFLADNHMHRSEILFPIAEDGNNTRNYGGVTFIMHAQVGGSMDTQTDFGIATPWSGNRFTNAFVNKFEDLDEDVRALVYTDGQTLNITNPTVFTQGYLCTKYRNITSGGASGQHNNFVDTDFPLFRYADVYLMYAEAVVRGGTGGDINLAVDYVNEIRERAFGNTLTNITSTDLTLDFILDERGRELFWEGHRRTDLIRFGKFTGDSYLWDWKGNVKDGASTAPHMALFPLPASDLAVNTNLEQNTGYN